MLVDFLSVISYSVLVSLFVGLSERSAHCEYFLFTNHVPIFTFMGLVNEVAVPFCFCRMKVVLRDMRKEGCAEEFLCILLRSGRALIGSQKHSLTIMSVEGAINCLGLKAKL